MSKNYIYLKCAIWWFDIHVFMKKILNRLIINTSFTSQWLLFFLVRTLKVSLLSNFQAHETILLTIVAMLCIRSPELVHLITEIFCPLTSISPSPSFPQTLVTTLLLSMSMSFFFFYFLGPHGGIRKFPG